MEPHQPIFCIRATRNGRSACIHAAAKDGRQAIWQARRLFNDWFYENISHSNPPINTECEPFSINFKSAMEKEWVTSGYTLLETPAVQEMRMRWSRPRPAPAA